jgi:hypothetical protein
MRRLTHERGSISFAAVIEGMAMTVFRLAVIVAGAAVALSFTALPQARATEPMAMRNRDVDLSSQQYQVRPYRVRPRVRVYRYPQPPFWEYPRPGVYSWPGPNAKRDCRAWYVVENRPSGAVMTPRMRCEWVPG